MFLHWVGIRVILFETYLGVRWSVAECRGCHTKRLRALVQTKEGCVVKAKRTRASWSYSRRASRRDVR